MEDVLFSGIAYEAASSSGENTQDSRRHDEKEQATF